MISADRTNTVKACALKGSGHNAFFFSVFAVILAISTLDSSVPWQSSIFSAPRKPSRVGFNRWSDRQSHSHFCGSRDWMQPVKRRNASMKIWEAHSKDGVSVLPLSKRDCIS